MPSSEPRCRCANGKRARPKRTGGKARYAGGQVKHKEAGRAVSFFSLCTEVVERPGIHQNMQQPAMQKTGSDQPPPLALRKNRKALFGSEIIQNLAVDRPNAPSGPLHAQENGRGRSEERR